MDRAPVAGYDREGGMILIALWLGATLLVLALNELIEELWP